MVLLSNFFIFPFFYSPIILLSDVKLLKNLLVKLRNDQKELTDLYRSIEMSAKTKYKYDFDFAMHSLKDIEPKIKNLVAKTSHALQSSKVALSHPSQTDQSKFSNRLLMQEGENRANE